MALLVERAQLGVGLLEGAARLREVGLDLQPARQEAVEQALQLEDRRIAIGEVLLELG